jgi:antitoxin (DNA-binding transcriptional repressor) of toxin-antitoxin stability system
MSTRTVSLQEAETRLRELIDLLDKGEDVEIVRDARPTIRLVVDRSRSKRRFGQHQGQGWISEDFDAALGCC